MEDPRSAVRSANKVDSTAYLREKLGFTDDAEWKRFSNRRLELINTLRLDEQKASKQEPQIRQVAERVAEEFRYTSDAVPDFERLVRLGIQSVRRNRRRPTKTGSLATTTFDIEVAHPPQLIQQQPTDIPLGALVDLCRPLCTKDNALISAGALRLALGLASQPQQMAAAQQVLAGLETGPLGDELARIIGAQSLSHAITTGCTRDQASCVHVLRALFAELLPMPDLAAMVHHVTNSELMLRNMWAATNSGTATTAPHQHQHQQHQHQHQRQHQQSQPSPSSVAPVMHPAPPCSVPMSIPTSRVPPPPPPPPQPGSVSSVSSSLSSSMSGTVGSVPQQPPPPPSVPAPATLPPLKGPMWAERLVTISHKNLEFKFTFSPLKGTPPTLHEIIESCRASFGLSTNDVLRVRTRDSGKIIDTNADLADAFLSNKLDLEIFLPPKPEPQF